jgi:hypothetical protein
MNEGKTMAETNDQLGIKRNFIALALFVLAILVLIDVVLRISPGLLLPGENDVTISAVGHHHEFADGSAYYIYTIFESDGDVYQCWWDEERWNQKKVTDYRGATLPERER